jgi:phenylacetaldehyde dehydrogenase
MMIQHTISPKTAAFLAGPHRQFIGGEWIPGQGRDIAVENPSDGSILTTFPAASLDQVDQAVAAARAAFKGAWGAMNARERAAVMMRFTDLIERDAEIIGEILCLEMGQPLASASGLVKAISAPLFRYYAGWTDKIAGDAFDPITGSGDVDHMAVTVMEPIGVVGAIIPWNASPGMMGLKLAPSLAAGCAVVLKTAELAPLCGAYYAKLWEEAGGPPGSLNVIHGYGDDVGAAMSAHPGIDKITFTGSTGVGKAIAAAATGNLKRVTLELGGKSPFIVFPDVDIPSVAKAAAGWCFVASGQACVAASRVFVHADIHDAFVAELRRITLALRVGDARDAATDLGPLISARQKARVAAYIQAGLDEGAAMVCGDEPVADGGHFLRPVVFTEVMPDMRIAREEIFGPVLSVFRFTDEDDLMRVVNDTPFGLSGSVWTNDITRGLRIARGIDAGQIGINVHAAMSPQTPFGGNKQSGWGREFGRKGLEEFLKIKAITIRLGERRAV